MIREAIMKVVNKENLTFEEAYSGVNKEINITRNEKCPTCSGTGAKPGTHPETCSICGGQRCRLLY